MPAPTQDVIVVGAGPGGSAVAAHLARQGARVLLLDKQQFPRDKTCGDALSPTAARLCRQLPQLFGGALDLKADSFPRWR